MPLATYGKELVLNVLFGGHQSRPTSLYLALLLNTPTDPDMTGTTMDEVSGDGYSRVQITNNTSFWQAASGESKYNSQSVLFPTAQGNWGTVRAWALTTAATGGQLIGWSPLISATPVPEGNQVGMSAGQMLIQAGDMS